MNINKRHKNDILLGTGLLLGALCLWCVIFFVQKSREQDGLTVVVTVDGEEYYRGKLADDTESTDNNGEASGGHSEKIIDIDGHNTVIISGGEVRMEEADCPDKLCISQGRISRPGQTIICLPNKVMVTIKGGKSEYDGVAK